MPDVHFWYSHSLFQEAQEYEVKKQLQGIVAEHMDCYDDKGEWIKHDPRTQIDVLTFATIDSGTTKDAIVQVQAYDWPDRMRDIDYRLTRIAEEVGVMVDDYCLEHHIEVERGPVAASFIPIPRGCWVKV